MVIYYYYYYHPKIPIRVTLTGTDYTCQWLNKYNCSVFSV